MGFGCQGPAHMISSSLKREQIKLERIILKKIKCTHKEKAYFFFPFELDTATHLPSYKVAAVFLSVLQIIGKALVHRETIASLTLDMHGY